ncbi:hypothetical protein HYX09_00290 [Candidatus Woesearchaeota archaeon]|nr:hypothetical protein [Candidatus Woesearchaeota archaeon]
MLKMISFLKRIFQKEEPVKAEKFIGFSDLERWLNTNAGFIVSQAGSDARKIMVDFNVKLNRLHWSVEALKNSELQNPDISIKAKQYMAGNREFYANAVIKWSESLKYGGNYGFEELRHFIVSFRESINELNKATLKSYTILQEFFANESSKVASIIKDMENSVNDLDSRLNSPKILDIEKIRNGIAGIKEKLTLREGMEKELGAISREIEDARKKREEMVREVDALKQSENFVRYKGLKQEREALLKSITSCEDIMGQSFSVLERALRKYSHIAFEHEQLIISYLSAPLDTLVGDKALVIMRILDKTRENLEKGVLRLDDDKKQKSLEEIKKLNNEFFTQMIGEYSAAAKRIKEIDKDIRELNLSAVMGEHNSRLNNIDFSIRNLDKSQAKVKEAIGKLAIDSSVAELESAIKNSFEEVKIRI